MSTENLSDRINFFKKLEGGKLNEAKKEKVQVSRATAKIRIPTIFESVSDNGKVEPRRYPFGSASNLSKNKFLDRSEKTQSACSLNHLGVETPALTKAKSQENIIDASVEEAQLSQNSVTSSFEVLSKFKAVENLADTENLDTTVKEIVEEENEVPKPRILDIVYKKMEQNAEDKNVEFRQRLNELKIKRTNSFCALVEEEKPEPKPPLFVKKLKEIRSKQRRSTDLDTPRTLVFNFIKKDENLSKSFSNLSSLHQEAEIEERKKEKPFHKSSDDIVKRHALLVDDLDKPTEGEPDKSEETDDATKRIALRIIPIKMREQYLQNEELDTQSNDKIVDNLHEINDPVSNGPVTPNLDLKQEIVFEAEEECDKEEMYVNEQVISPPVNEDESLLKVIPKVAPRSRNISENLQEENDLYVNDTLQSPDADTLTSYEQSYDELTGRKSSSTSFIHDNIDPTPKIILQVEAPDAIYENQMAVPKPAPRRLVDDGEEYANLPLNSPPVSPRSENGFPKAAPRTKTPHTSESEMNAKEYIRQRSISIDEQNGASMYENLYS